mmetsp:Transcript_28246/g.81396  ORF Transcript_28246/g.81396 Transcript_28246/m.81396 type:complete len:115 (+) Transcript_28246:667-1011(+)
MHAVSPPSLPLPRTDGGWMSWVWETGSVTNARPAARPASQPYTRGPTNHSIDPSHAHTNPPIFRDDNNALHSMHFLCFFSTQHTHTDMHREAAGELLARGWPACLPGLLVVRRV